MGHTYIYAVIHDDQVTSTDKHYLDHTTEQWELVLQMLMVLKPLQVATTALSYEQKVSLSLIYPTVQTSHNLDGTREQNAKNAFHSCANAKIKFSVCLHVLFESVAERIYSCWIIVSRRFIVINRTL